MRRPGLRRAPAPAGRRLASWIAADPDWELLGASAGAVCFRVRPRGWPADDPRLDALNARLLAAASAGERLGLSPARLGGRTALRLAVGPGPAEARRVQAAWERLRAEALRLGAGPTLLA